MVLILEKLDHQLVVSRRLLAAALLSGARRAGEFCASEPVRAGQRAGSAGLRWCASACILHVYILVGLQVAVLQYAWPVGVKFLAVAVAGVALSLGIGHFSSTVPGLGLVLGARKEQ
jgi:hypothetical protein